MADSDDLILWLRAAFSKPNATPSPLPNGAVSVLLSQIDRKTGGVAAETEEFHFVPGTDSFEELAERIEETATRDSEAMGGATYGVSVEGVKGRFSLSFAVADAISLERVPMNTMQPQNPRIGFSPGYGQQVPDAAWAMQLKHNEFAFETALGGTATIIKLMQKIIADQAHSIEQLEKGRFKSFELLEELASQKHLRDLEMGRMAKGEARKDKVFGFVEPLAFGLMAKYFGGKAVPDGMAPVVQMISSAFSDMTPDGFAKIMSSDVFSANQKMCIKELFSFILQVQDEKAAPTPEKVASSATASATR